MQWHQNQPHSYTAGTGDKLSGRQCCKLGAHFLAIASRPPPCQSPAKEQAQSGLKNHFAILCLVAISTAETGSTCSKLKQVKRQHKVTKPRVGRLIFPSHIHSLSRVSHRNQCAASLAYKNPTLVSSFHAQDSRAVPGNHQPKDSHFPTSSVHITNKSWAVYLGSTNTKHTAKVSQIQP